MASKSTTEVKDEELDAVERARREDCRSIIDDCGAWRWCLSVESDGTVRAAKPIPYDGVLVFSTSGEHSSRKRDSETHLDVDEVVKRYCQHSRSPRSKQDLLEDVREARSEKGV